MLFTGELLTAVSTAATPSEDEDEAETNISISTTERENENRFMPRGLMQFRTGSYKIRRIRSPYWMFDQNNTVSHETQKWQPCPNQVCTCIATPIQTFQSCDCVDKDIRCWYVGSRCFCRYGDKNCISKTTGGAAQCPVDHVKTASVCRVDEDGDVPKFQCLPSNTNKSCDVLMCAELREPRGEDVPITKSDCMYYSAAFIAYL